MARDLHDQTLQSLELLRVLLAGALRRGDPTGSEEAMRQAIEDMDSEIENAAIITDLRPSLLDDLGLLPAIESLIERRRESGAEITTEFHLSSGQDSSRLWPASWRRPSTASCREAPDDVDKHARATIVHVLVDARDSQVVLEVRDDGSGFDTTTKSDGFGLTGLQERVFLAGGYARARVRRAGTTVRAHLPKHTPAATNSQAPMSSASKRVAYELRAGRQSGACDGRGRDASRPCDGTGAG